MNKASELIERLVHPNELRDGLGANLTEASIALSPSTDGVNTASNVVTLLEAAAVQVSKTIGYAKDAGAMRSIHGLRKIDRSIGQALADAHVVLDNLSKMM